jgi:hypothetical protein
LFDAGIIALMIPILALTIPIVVILTNHQRKMAEIMHSSQPLPSGELDAIRQELQQLRMLMNQHTIALDDVRSKQALPPSSTNMQDRLGAS